MSCTGCHAEMELNRTRVAMCTACPWVVRNTRGHLVLCRIDHDGIAGRTSCPHRRYPDASGVLRWLGLRWYGVPAPLRWWLQERWGLLQKTTLPGCGCIVVLKNLVGRFNGRHQGRQTTSP